MSRAHGSGAFASGWILRATSSSERTPHNSPAESVTGSRRTCFRCIIRSASQRSVSGEQEWTFPVITSLTRIVAGSRRWHPVAIQTSRSVIIPTTCPLLSTTGSTPQSRIHIDCATAAKSVSGAHVFTSFVITSFTFMRLCLSKAIEGHTRLLRSTNLAKNCAVLAAPKRLPRPIALQIRTVNAEGSSQGVWDRKQNRGEEHEAEPAERTPALIQRRHVVEGRNIAGAGDEPNQPGPEH